MADGGLGHFPPDTTERMLVKIRGILTHEGVFVGSESLGKEGHDHLQFFDTLEELSGLFREYFANVELRKIEYGVPAARRVEAFWRCADDRSRLDEARWLAVANQPNS